jgi:nucleoside-diphosphate-sugar epimerase
VKEARVGEKVFLTGGSGRIGWRVERKLLERGYTVRSLVHRRRANGRPHSALESVRGDILNQEGLTGARLLLPDVQFRPRPETSPIVWKT